MDGKKPVVLIVDDMPENLEVLADLLAKESFDVAVAGGGRQALTIASSHPPDLILLDVNMPDMDGFTTCELLKKDPVTQNIPVIFFSALSEEKDILRGFDAGGTDYITKPFRLPELLARVRTHLELKREKEELLISHERLTTILDSSDSLVYVADFNSYEILFLNRYGRDLFGEVQGQKCWQAIQKGQKGPCSFCTNNRLVSSAGIPTEVYRWEFQNTITDKWFDCRDLAISWPGKRLVRMEIATDITEQKKVEREQREMEKIVTLGHLAAGAAHEFNNPLGVIIGFAQVALLELQNNRGNQNKMKNALETILRNANRCKNIVANLLNYGNGSAAERTPLKMNELIEESLALVDNQSPLKKIQITKEYAEGIPEVTANRTQVIQVLNNILYNAIEAMEGKGILGITTREKSGYVQAVFRDNGRGVKKENLSKVFDPFFTTREVGGLGLSVCAGIVKSYKGFISLESPGEGKGATVSIRLPINNTSQGGQK